MHKPLTFFHLNSSNTEHFSRGLKFWVLENSDPLKNDPYQMSWDKKCLAVHVWVQVFLFSVITRKSQNNFAIALILFVLVIFSLVFNKHIENLVSMQDYCMIWHFGSVTIITIHVELLLKSKSFFKRSECSRSEVSRSEFSNPFCCCRFYISEELN